MIDVLVTTGATLYHDAYETIGGKHFLGTDQIDNVMLRRQRIDRVYDVYADENKFYHLDTMIEKEFSSTLSLIVFLAMFFANFAISWLAVILVMDGSLRDAQGRQSQLDIERSGRASIAAREKKA